MLGTQEVENLLLANSHEDATSIIRLFDCLANIAYYRCRVLAPGSYILELVTQGVFDLVGFNHTDLIQYKHNTFERMMPADDRRRQAEIVAHSIMHKTPYDLTYRLNSASESTQWVWDRGRVLYNKDGTPQFLEGIITNVNSQKQRELELQEENERLRASLVDGTGFHGIIGASEVMQHVFTQIARASVTDANVVIYGETGTGKELTAQAIHEKSSRNGPFVPVNCGAIPAQLMESEFFGYKRGAFSGAVNNRPGFLAAAAGGTLFLDEVGELDLGMQVKLLRALESKQYTPMGDNMPCASDFRLIAATNRDLAAMVRNKTLREDFFYRIHVLDIHMPPLRERKGDIPLLIKHFLQKKSLQSGAYISPSTWRTLESYTWPGNIRELQNVLEKFICFGHLDLACPGQESPCVGTETFTGKTLKMAVEELERHIILDTLAKLRWKRAETAQALDINLRTLQRKMRQYGI